MSNIIWDQSTVVGEFDSISQIHADLLKLYTVYAKGSRVIVSPSFLTLIQSGLDGKGLLIKEPVESEYQEHGIKYIGKDIFGNFVFVDGYSASAVVTILYSTVTTIEAINYSFF